MERCVKNHVFEDNSSSMRRAASTVIVLAGMPRLGGENNGKRPHSEQVLTWLFEKDIQKIPKNEPTAEPFTSIYQPKTAAASKAPQQRHRRRQPPAAGVQRFEAKAEVRHLTSASKRSKDGPTTSQKPRQNRPTTWKN